MSWLKQRQYTYRAHTVRTIRCTLGDRIEIGMLSSDNDNVFSAWMNLVSTLMKSNFRRSKTERRDRR